MIMKLKDKCKAVRNSMAISQKEFAETFLGTNQTEVSFIERGFIPEDKNKRKTINYLYNLIINFDKNTLQI